jgi:hypothetical protein
MTRCTALLAAILCGCTTITTTEQTETTRPAGAATSRHYDKPAAGDILEFRTAREPDGFEFFRSAPADEQGSATVTLLPAALQCLVYKHDVKLKVYSLAQDGDVHTETIDAERARRIVEEWLVQARLGAAVPLRKSEQALLRRAIEASADAPLVDALTEIEKHVETLPDWR